MLNGIHEPTEQVELLMMKDKSGWTPVHLAAGQKSAGVNIPNKGDNNSYELSPLVLALCDLYVQ